MKLFKTSFSDLSSIKGPSDLLTLQLSQKSLTSLPDITDYKNLVLSKQIELDISSNQLKSSCHEIITIKSLRKLNLSRNQISIPWPLPDNLEDLDLSYNKISYLNDCIISLGNLHTLDLSFNLISGFSSFEAIKSLKYLYINNNLIDSVAGIEKMNLIEVDLSENKLENMKSLLGLDQNPGLLVINLKNNRVLNELEMPKSGFFFDSAEDVLRKYSQAEPGLFYKNFDLLSKMKNSKFKGLIKRLKAEQRDKSQLASPDWGNSRKIEESEFSGNTLEHPEKVLVFENEEEASLKKVPISKLNLEKIGTKPSCEKSSTKPETSLESLFEDIIAYFQIEENKEKEFSFSTEKYEQAVNFLKKKEDERKLLLQKKEIKLKNLEIVKGELENQCLINGELKRNLESLSIEMYQQSALIQKLAPKKGVEVNVQTVESDNDISFDSSLSSYSNLPYLGGSAEFSKHIGGSDYLVHTNVKVYIEKLLKKISELVSKKRALKKENKKLSSMISKNNKY